MYKRKKRAEKAMPNVFWIDETIIRDQPMLKITNYGDASFNAACGFPAIFPVGERVNLGMVDSNPKKLIVCKGTAYAVLPVSGSHSSAKIKSKLIPRILSENGIAIPATYSVAYNESLKAFICDYQESKKEGE